MPALKLATVRSPAGTHAVLIDGKDAVEIEDFADVGSLLSEPDWMTRAASADGSRRVREDTDLAPVVLQPSKIICIGLNYRSHIAETGRETPEHPTLFSKFARALIGPRDPILLPIASEMVDWEAELAFVIGRPLRHADPEEARSAIGGFTILNDVSVRDFQQRTLQWLQGKTFEKSTPVGPWLTTTDEVDDARDLHIQCEVEGEVVQESRTSDLLFSPAEIAAYISQIVTLDPGDLIATGTPSGVGMARSPQRWLQPGQTVRTSVEGLGELLNTCMKEEL